VMVAIHRLWTRQSPKRQNPMPPRGGTPAGGRQALISRS
jgi:hypothetical protein